MTLASLPSVPAPTNAPASWSVLPTAAGCDCAEVEMGAFGELLQMLGTGEPAAEGFSGVTNGGFTMKGSAAPESAGATVPRQLLPHNSVNATGLGMIVAPGEMPDLPQDANQAAGVDLQALFAQPEQAASEPAPAQVTSEHATPQADGLPAEAFQVERAGMQTGTPEVQSGTSGDPVEVAEGQRTRPEVLPLPAASVIRTDSAGIGRTGQSGEPEMPAEESEQSEPEAEPEAEVLVLSPPMPLRDDKPVLKPPGDLNWGAERSAQAPLPDRGRVPPELTDSVAGGTAPDGGGGKDEGTEVAFSAKLMECERASAPEAVEAPTVLPRTVNSVSEVSAHTAAPVSASAHAAHEYAAKPASAFQAPVVIEPVAPPEASVASGPARELRLSVAQESGTGSRLEVRVSERAGEIRVNVQSPDPNVRAAVRSELSSLVNRLEQAGYNAEVFQPQPGRASDEVAVTESSRVRPDSDSDHHLASADAASRDSSGWDSNEGRRERREAPPRPFAPARPKAPGRRFFDEFIR